MKESSHSPFFSVIICTYNRAHLIERALKSLLHQTEKDWEALIVDDGSTDHTEEIVQPYLEIYPIRYLKKEHSGLAKSRNFGIKNAKGKFLTFLDTDDTYHREHLSSRHKILMENPGIDLLHSNVTVIGDPYLPDKDDPGKKIHVNDCTVGGTFFIKRAKLTPEDYFRDRYSDDSLFMEQAKSEKWNVLKIDNPTYIYNRQEKDSLTNRY